MLSKKKIEVIPLYFLYPDVKLIFAKPLSFSLLSFFICVNVKYTISITLHDCIVIYYIPINVLLKI